MAGVLDTDMTTLARTLRRGIAWWLDELRDMLPRRLRELGNAPPAIVARWTGSGFILSRDGTALAATPDPRRPRAVAVELPGAMVLTRDVTLPPLGRRDLARLIELDAERLMPFPPGTAVVSFVAGGGGQVAVAAMPRSDALTVLAAARQAGLAPRSLGLAGGFDFLPRLAAPGGQRGQRFWWSAVGVMALLLVTTVIGLDVQRTRQLEALVTAHGDAAASARAVRLRVIGEDARRRAWLARRATHDPLALLAAATRALPEGAWVQRLDFDGTRLRLAGYKAGNIDLVAALRKVALFARVRPSNSDIAPPQAQGQPFDVTAELASTR